MDSINFITSYLTFYMKGEIKQEKNFVKFTIPNSILTFIPLGSYKKTIAINQISSVDTNFELLFKNLVYGVIEVFIGFGTIASGIGLIFLLLGVLTILNAFQTILAVSLTSGEIVKIPFVIFEKQKASNAADRINELISGRLDDTNNREQTDRIVDAINSKK